jgi:branched-chain amino acid aminotransferase
MAQPPKIPLHDRDGFIWVDGKMVPWREAKVHVLTHSLHYATQVFEGERVYNGRIFKSQDHTDRLFASAKMIHMTIPVEAKIIEEAKQEVLKANKLTSAYVRPMAWRGSESLGVGFNGTSVHVMVAAWDWGSYFSPEILEKGIALKTSRWKKPAPDTAPIHSKTSSHYNLGTMVREESLAAGYTDGLMHDFEGYIAECTGANIFFIKDGALITPIADRFLNGITRQTVLQIARDLGIKTEERRVKPEELGNFDEVFVTGSAAEVTPVGKIDSLEFKVGPVTRRLRSAYLDLVNGVTPGAAKAVNS